MKISKNAVNLVKEFEGYHKRLPNGDCTTYVCPAGVLTLGYGSTTGFKKGDVWTHAKAVSELKKTLEEFAGKVADLLTVEVNQNQFDALASFAYNVGVGAVSRSTLLKRVNAGDFEAAAKEFAKWNKGGGRVLSGLVTRRAREAELFATPVEEEPAPSMPQAVDAPAEGGGVFSNMSFSQVNEVADQGSRLAGWIRTVKQFFWGRTAVTTTGTVALLATNTGTRSGFESIVCDHPILAVAIAFILGGVGEYFGTRLIQKYLLTAVKDGRYKPKGSQ